MFGTISTRWMCCDVQAGERIRAYSKDQRARFIENLEMWMTEPKTTDEVGMLKWMCAVHRLLPMHAVDGLCVERQALSHPHNTVC